MTNSRASSIQLTGAVVKSADQSVTSSTTLVNDTELKITLKASKTYLFHCFLLVNAGATGLIKYLFVAPSGATALRADEGTTVLPVSTQDALSNQNGTTDGNDECMELWGRVIMSTTVGDLQFKFAQQVSNGTATKVLQGSTLIVYETT